MNYLDFEKVMNTRNLTPSEVEQQKVLNMLNAHTKLIDRLLKLVEAQREQIKQLSDTVYKIAPELDVIEMVAESPEEETELIDRYMNRNSEWTTDSTWYDTQKIIEEMAQGDGHKQKFLIGCLEDDGANFVTQLYKRWKGIDHMQNIIDNLKL